MSSTIEHGRGIEPTNDKPRLNAAEYSRYGRHQRKIAFRLLAENYALIASLGGPPCSALDAGCATGDTSKMLSYFANVSRVLALDESAEMLAVAQTFNSDDRIRYELADMSDYFRLPRAAFEEQEGFDLVCCFDCLQWMREPLRGLATLGRCVRIGGLLIGYTAARLQLSFALIQPYLAETVGLPYAPWFDDDNAEQSMGEALETIGFEVIKCSLEDDMIIYTQNEAIGSLLTLKNVFSKNHSKTETDRIIDIYLNSFDQLADNNFGERSRIIEFVARKVCNV